MGKLQELQHPDVGEAKRLLQEYLNRADEFEHVVILVCRKDGYPEHVASSGMMVSRICWLHACFGKWIQESLL